MKAPRFPRRSSPLAFPTSDTPGTGVSLEPSSHQIGAQAAQASRELEGMGDMATTRQSLAQLAPTQNRTHMAGFALRGLQKAAGL